MAAKIHVIFYSMYGHVWKMAEAIAEGARSVAKAQVSVFQIAETLPGDVLEKMHASEAKKAFAHIPIAKPAQLVEADGIIFGTPTRFGSSCAQMQTFLDGTGSLWGSGALIGKVGSVFTSTASQHGGQESTILGLSTFFYHQGMVLVGCPYAAKGLLLLSEITGGSPYGAATIAGGSGERQPSGNELDIARFQGKHVTEITSKLVSGTVGL